MTEPEVVELWRSRDGLWRYRFVPPRGGRAIRSNRAFLSRQEALDSIRIAYPGLPPREIDEPLPESGRRWGRRLAGAAVGAGVVLSVAAVVKVAVRARRAVAKVKRVARYAALVAAAVDRRRPPDG